MIWSMRIVGFLALAALLAAVVYSLRPTQSEYRMTLWDEPYDPEGLFV
jgi:hypothetical protein